LSSHVASHAMAHPQWYYDISSFSILQACSSTLQAHRIKHGAQPQQPVNARIATWTYNLFKQDYMHHDYASWTSDPFKHNCIYYKNSYICACTMWQNHLTIAMDFQGSDSNLTETKNQDRWLGCFLQNWKYKYYDQ
jgi:hypothetical protein